MRASTTCPDVVWWNDLLEGRRAGEHLRSDAHLEECPTCQQTLEQLTGADAAWAEAARHLEQRPRALRRTMDVLKATPDAGDAGAETMELECVRRSADRAFLRISGDPLHRGRLGPYEALEAPATTRAPALPQRTRRRSWSRKWLLLAPVVLMLMFLPITLGGFAMVSLFNLIPNGVLPNDLLPVLADEEPGEPQVLAADDPAFKELEQKLDGDVFARIAATKQFARTKPNERQPEVAQKLAQLAAFDDQFTRTGALRALSLWGTPKEVPALIAALDHMDVFTRREALKAVGPFRAREALPPVMRGFKEF